MKRMLWRFGLMAICMLLIFTSYGQIAKAATTGTEGSKIAGIDVEGFARGEIKQLLESEVSSWLQGEPIVLTGEYEQFSVSRKAFGFDIDSTLDEWEQQTKRSWSSFFLKKKHVELPLVVTFKQPEKEALPDRFDKEKVASRLESQVGMLGKKAIEVDYIPELTPEPKKLASVKLNFPQSVDAQSSKLAREFNEVKIKPDKEFSFLEYVSRIGRADQSVEDLQVLGAEADFYATAFYKLIMQTDLEFVEHHSQGSVPSYGETGIEAAVDLASKKDLKVFNASRHTYELRAHVADDELTLSLFGVEQSKAYEYVISNRTYVTPRTVYRYSQALAPGEETIIQNGQAGVRVKVYRNELDEADELIDKELVEEVTYPALPNIKLVSTENSTEADAVDTPLSDLEDWMNTIFEGETDESDKVSEADVDEAVEDIDEQTKKAKQPMIDTYVEALLDAYCEGAVEADSETTEQTEMSEAKNQETKDKKTSTTEKVDEKQPTEQTEKKKQTQEVQDFKDDKEVEPVTTEFLDKLENRCTNDRDALREQLKNYLILESIVENPINQKAE